MKGGWGSPWVLLCGAGRERLPLAERLHDFLRVRGLRNGPLFWSPRLSPWVFKPRGSSCVPSAGRMAASGGGAHGDFLGGPGLRPREGVVFVARGLHSEADSWWVHSSTHLCHHHMFTQRMVITKAECNWNSINDINFHRSDTGTRKKADFLGLKTGLGTRSETS